MLGFLLGIWSIALFAPPYSLALSALLLSCTVGILFMFDLIVKDDGIYFGIFIPFDKIENISDSFVYVTIVMGRGFFRYFVFYKLLYKFTAEDIKRIRTLLK